MNHLIILIAAAIPAAAAPAPSPRAELKAAIEQLQKTPDDAVLREKIIKLANTVKPAPAIPEEARKHLVQAMVLQKDAKTPADYDDVLAEYGQALRLAPWWGSAYYNLSTADEAAGRLDAAASDLKLFLATKPKEEDARQAQDRLYGLEAKQKKAAKAKAAKADAARAEEAKYGRWLGSWTKRTTAGGWNGSTEEVVEAKKQGDQILFTSLSGVNLNGSGAETARWDRRQDVLRATIGVSGDLSWEQKHPATPTCNDSDWSSVSVTAPSEGRSIAYDYPGIWAGRCTPSGNTYHVELTR